ncbi:MAG: right-handed parallel beta-helix repeat-containing protein [Sedimentisphaerales bacterium]|nr:right-handed parallel beta-helix repeat-containing protein [Sedimentisphaerales bacterium]
MKIHQSLIRTSILQVLDQWRNLFVLALILCLLLALCPAVADDYFVDPNGNDTTGDGSIGNPWQTIPKAVSIAVAGDTIYLRGGQHDYSSTISITTSGSSSNRITLQNYQDENAIIDFSDQQRVSNYRGIELHGDYWHFKGFTIRRSADNAIFIDGSYHILEQIVVYENGDSGIQIYASSGTYPSYNQIINCDSYLNYDPYKNGENADGFAAKGPTPAPDERDIGPGNVFRGCRAWSNSDDGWDFWYAGSGVLAEDCWTWSNGINIWSVSPFNGDGNGFKLGQGGGEHVLIRCIAFDLPAKGFDLNRSTTDATGVTLYNCTAYNNSSSNFTFLNPTTGAIHVLRNNISYTGSVNIGSLIDDTYNSWNGFSVSSSDFVSLDHTGIDGPRGPNGELPKLGFLRLADGSSMINAGTDVGEPFVGSGPELGAFERAELVGDCEPDGDIDWADLACLLDNWLDTGCGYCSGADLNDDNNVDFIDYSILADNWMQ